MIQQTGLGPYSAAADRRRVGDHSPLSLGPCTSTLAGDSGDPPPRSTGDCLPPFPAAKQTGRFRPDIVSHAPISVAARLPSRSPKRRLPCCRTDRIAPCNQSPGAGRCLSPSRCHLQHCGCPCRRRVSALDGKLAAAGHVPISSIRLRHITGLFGLFLPGVQPAGVHGPAERPDGVHK
jgi:hypothetical protein